MYSAPECANHCQYAHDVAMYENSCHAKCVYAWHQYYMHKEKFLSLVLRHKPEVIGLTLDPNGWVLIDDLVAAVDQHKGPFTDMDLFHIVEKSEKKRFEYDETKTKVRACQGHSIPVDLGLKPQEPPAVLYHGTAKKNIESILKTGINSGTRHAVQLSNDVATAISVGARHGKPVVLSILAQDMHKDGHVFTKSTNGVWLTQVIPPAYIAFTDLPD